MKNKLSPVTPGNILLEEFLEPTIPNNNVSSVTA